MWPALRRSALALALTVGLGTTAHALDFDHLILGKVKGGLKSTDYHADLDASGAVYAALHGTGCRIWGSPRMMLFPVTKSNVTPTPPNTVPSLTLTSAHPSQVFVCYKLRCPIANPLPGPDDEILSFKDQLAINFDVVFPASSRMLCVPAMVDYPPCGTPGDDQCGGSCASGKQCIENPGSGLCECVDVPVCGQGDSMCLGKNCPDGYTCGSHQEEGRCKCLPSCEASSDCRGFCAGEDAYCQDTGSGCQCVVACGVIEPGNPCDPGSCPGITDCVPDGDGCACH